MTLRRNALAPFALAAVLAVALLPSPASASKADAFEGKIQPITGKLFQKAGRFELTLSFDASALPPVEAGRVRSFLLDSRGFSKEMDINSASPDVVLPLPYDGMKAYPYAEADVSAAVRRAAEQAEAWNTRRVVRPIVPIELFAADAGTSPRGPAVPADSSPHGKPGGSE